MSIRCIAARSVCAQVAWTLLLAGCSADDEPDAPPADGGFAGFPAIDAQYPHDGMPLAIAALEPAGGSPRGGDLVRVRGQGFGKDLGVSIDGEPVELLTEVSANDRELWIRMPPHVPGAVDVAVRSGEVEARLDSGYVYWPFAIEPRSGPIAGGTRMTLDPPEGETLDVRSVRVGGEPCADLERSDAGSWSCTTAAAEVPGIVDVIATLRDGSAARARASFVYFDGSDSAQGYGLRGGPLGRTLEVTVWDWTEVTADTRREGAWVLIEDSTGQRFTGRTDARGQWVVDDPALRAPVDLHVFTECSGYVSILGVDRSVAIVRTARLPLVPACAEPGSSEPTAVGMAGGVISGHVVIPGGWESLPEPVGDEHREVHLGTTKATLWFPNPNANVGGARSVITEDDAGGAHVSSFSIFARTGALAVYALAGLATDEPDSFVPYAMGVARGVTVSPGDTRNGVLIEVDIELNHELEVALDGLPELSQGGPIRVTAALDLGAEGVLVRHAGKREFDVMEQHVSAPVRFAFRSSVAPALADARLRVRAERTGNRASTAVGELFDAQSTEVRLSDALGLPEWSSEPSERKVIWTLADELDMQELTVTGAWVWRITAPGHARSITLPDPSLVDERLIDPLRTTFALEWRGYDPAADLMYGRDVPLPSALGRSATSSVDLPLFAPGSR